MCGVSFCIILLRACFRAGCLLRSARKPLVGLGFWRFLVAGSGWSGPYVSQRASAIVVVAVPKVGEVSGQSRRRQRGGTAQAGPSLAGRACPCGTDGRTLTSPRSVALIIELLCLPPRLRARRCESRTSIKAASAGAVKLRRDDECSPIVPSPQRAAASA